MAETTKIKYIYSVKCELKGAINDTFYVYSLFELIALTRSLSIVMKILQICIGEVYASNGQKTPINSFLTDLNFEI